MFARMHLAFAMAIGAVATLAVAQQPAQNPAPRNPAVQRGAPATQQQQFQQQQQGNPRQQGQQQRVTANRLPAGEATNNDQMIAQCLAIDNEEEIAIAKLAAAKSTDRAVRDFAERLIKDHTSLLAELERFGARPIGLDREDNRPQA